LARLLTARRQGHRSLLATVAMSACFLAGRRALRVDPVDTLRNT
jgi:hypothetical protein